MKEKLYQSIERKLGCDPLKYQPIYDQTENDGMESPLSKLSLEELLYFREIHGEV